MSAFDQVFPSPRVSFVHGAVGACEGQLLAPEKEAIASAIETRRHQYSSVRVCARRAMAELGVEPSPVLNAEDRSPLWPDGVVGSLSHTRRHCGAALARRADAISVGIDIESDQDLPPRLWTRVCTPSELRRIEGLPSSDRGRMARAVFCVKECFYKLQYPLTRSFLGFGEAEAEIDLAAGLFRLRLLADAGELAVGEQFEGRIARGDGLLVAGMVVLES